MLEFFSPKGRVARKEYFLAFFAIGIFWVGLSYLFRNHFGAGPESKMFFPSKLILEVIALTSVMPIMLKRTHDIHLPGYVLLILWVAIPFSIRNTFHWKELFGIELDPFSWPVTIIHLLGLAVFLMLFLYKSYPRENKWGKP